MELKRLKQAMREPKTRRELLDGYPGRATVGITSDPADEKRYALVVHIQATVSGQFPDTVEVDNEAVTVVVREDFEVPVLN